MTTQDLQEKVKSLAPAKIDDLWARQEEESSTGDPQEIVCSRPVDPESLTHIAAERLFDWCSDEQVSALLEDEKRLQSLVTELADAAFHLGFNAQNLQRLFRQHRQKPNAKLPVLIVPCSGCNTPYDNGGCCRSSSDAPKHERADLETAFGKPSAAIVSHNLHRCVKLCALTANLLSKRHSYLLAKYMTPEPPVGMAASDFINQLAQSGKRGFVCVLQLFALLDNASHCFPKAAMYAGACLSLTVSRRPAQAFQLLDPDAMARVMVPYLKAVIKLVWNSECIFEEAYGVVAFINILPILYCFGDWKQIHRPMQKYKLVESITIATCHILNSVWNGVDDDRIDVPLTYLLGNMPALQSAVVFIDPRIKSKVLKKNPMSWCVVASLEVLTKWASRGIPVGTECVPTVDTGSEVISDFLQETVQWIEEGICEELRPLALRMMQDIIACRQSTTKSSRDGNVNNNDDILNEKEEEEEEMLLSKRMAKLAKRCAWCGKTSGPISKCSGGCLGMAQYCCKQHQRKHWKQHKEFCRNNVMCTKRVRNTMQYYY